MIFNPPKKIKNISWSKIKVGDSVDFSAVIRQSDIDSFIKFSGDINPMHIEQSFAVARGFKQPIVHGMLAASFFSTLVGTYLPGLNNLYISQEVKFKKPIFVGERLKVVGKVKRKIESVKTIYLETLIYNPKGQVAVEGQAIVKYLS